MCSACSATTSASVHVAEETRWEGPKESGQVKSHIKNFPSFHGSNKKKKQEQEKKTRARITPIIITESKKANKKRRGLMVR